MSEEKLSKKELIIKHARASFSKYGYELTTLDAIAKECLITKPAIYYHFKDKATLYKAVVCPEFTAIATKIEQNTQQGTPLERIQSYVETFGEFLINHPDFSAIFAREIANGAVTIPNDCIKQLSRTLKQLINILDDGEKEGIFQKEEPFLIQMMIVTTLTSYNTSKPLRERIAHVIDTQNAQEPNFQNIIKSLYEKIKKGLIC
ncbi:Transcriptional regulator, TetR family [hydrothermal vent metagenome]|uniref:Transcriptional regulator, TetR family n=1 Tax=hydrothermal vent metagenome TaxID=652676 RepID=A0A1W1D3Y0_9ZZZZ